VTLREAPGKLEYKAENTPHPNRVQITKVDSEAERAGQPTVVQGDTTLASTYEIINRSNKPIVYYDRYTQNEYGDLVGVGTGTTVAVGDAIPKTLTCSKDSSNKWVTDVMTLPYGKYEVREIGAGEGMVLDTSWSDTLTLHDLTEVKTFSTKQGNVPMRVGLRLFKVDESYVQPGWLISGNTIAAALGQGDAELTGAEFTIRNVSTGPVLVGGQWFQPGEDITNTILITRLEQDAQGNDIVVARTANGKTLPYGRYEVRETKAPKGYNAIVGILGGTAVVAHPTQEQYAAGDVWYTTGWDVSEYVARINSEYGF
jgi:hypothetical protein